jgi:ABC-type histidine transport system ATPase subunit
VPFGLLSVARQSRARAGDRTLAVPPATQAFDEALRLTDPGVRAAVAGLLADLAERARATADLAA